MIDLLRDNVATRDLPINEEPYKTALEVADLLDGRPRYPKMHPCGVVLSCQPMHELTPTFISNKGLPTTHYDMDGVEDIGLVKMDILARGGLAVRRDACESIAGRGIQVDLGALEPWEDPKVWNMIALHGRNKWKLELHSSSETPFNGRAVDHWVPWGGPIGGANSFLFLHASAIRRGWQKAVQQLQEPTSRTG